jgi:hypothetical protein
MCLSFSRVIEPHVTNDGNARKRRSSVEQRRGPHSHSPRLGQITPISGPKTRNVWRAGAATLNVRRRVRVCEWRSGRRRQRDRLDVRRTLEALERFEDRMLRRGIAWHAAVRGVDLDVGGVGIQAGTPVGHAVTT